MDNKPKSQPTPMPEWMARQLDNAEAEVATWSDAKCEAAGIPRKKPFMIKLSFTKNRLESLKEQVQEDLIGYFDGCFDEDKIMDGACQIIVDRINDLIVEGERSSTNEEQSKNSDKKNYSRSSFRS